MSESFIDKDTIQSKLGMNSSSIERILGLEPRSLSNQSFIELPETQALLKITYSMPWLLEVIHYDFDPEIAEAILLRQAAIIKIQERSDILKNKT